MTKIKDQIDIELENICMTDKMKREIRAEAGRRPFRRMAGSLAASLAIIILCGTTAFAGYYIYNKVMVNDEVLPELDQMYNVEACKVDMESDEYGMINGEVESYHYIQEEMGITLLNSDMSTEHPYMQVDVQTDNKDYMMISVRNYILGDTTNYKLSEEGFYQYDQGEEYYSPVSLGVDIMLSEEQMENGWETDYLGYYQFTEQYTSEQGYKVNIIEDTTGDKEVDNFVSEKCAIFVADGIRYTIKGRTTIDNIKDIVESMK